MSEESKKLGSLTAIEYLLNLDGISVAESTTSLHAASLGHFQSKTTFSNTLNLLANMQYVDISDNKVLKKKSFNKTTFITDFILHLDQTDVLCDFFDSTTLRLDAVKNQYYLFANTISLSLSAIRNFLIESQFLIQDSSKLKLYINNEFKEFTEDFLFPLIENGRKKGGMSPSQLKKQLAYQEECGLEAELFVLKFERNRLRLHKRVNNIEHVAQYDVTAGFDILSFSTNQSYILDREIEVKSYEDQPHFYLSRIEYNRAKENKNGYFIYLIDRKKINNSDYCPEIIQNPYETLNDSTMWSCTIEKFHYIKVEPH